MKTQTTQTQVPFFKHDLGTAELESLKKVFEGYILTTGDYVAEFEKKLASYLGCEYALGVTHCTGAMHLSLIALGINPGDEVITTPLTFVATAQAIAHVGAKPVFVEVEPTTGNLDIEKVEKAITPKTKAILPVHLYGQMVDMKKLKAIAQAKNLKIIEDSAHALESERDGIRTANVSDTSCYSFFATKNITCGEGGAIATNSKELYQHLKQLRNHSMDKTAADRFREGFKHWDVKELGWKYNMSNIEASLLLPQFDRIEKNLTLRQALYKEYIQKLSELEGLVKWPLLAASTKHSHHLFTVWIPGSKRDAVIDRLTAAGIGCVVNYRPVHLLTWFKETYGYREGDFPIAEKIGGETLSLPFYPNMPFEHVDIVVKTLKAALQDVA